VKTALLIGSTIFAVVGFASAQRVAGLMPDTWAYTVVFIVGGALVLAIMLWAIYASDRAERRK
jgi:hypothetical protein